MFLLHYIYTGLIHCTQSAVDEVIERMDEYYLSKEDWDTVIELGVDENKDDLILKKISTATKMALTRKYISHVFLLSVRRSDVPPLFKIQLERPSDTLPQSARLG